MASKICSITYAKPCIHNQIVIVMAVKSWFKAYIQCCKIFIQTLVLTSYSIIPEPEMFRIVLLCINLTYIDTMLYVSSIDEPILVKQWKNMKLSVGVAGTRGTLWIVYYI